MTASADGSHARTSAPGRVVVERRWQSIAGGERDEQVAARVPAGPAGAGDPEAGPLGEALALVGEQRSIGRDDDDDRARTRRRTRGRRVGRPRGSAPRTTGIASPTRTPSTRSQSRFPWFAWTSAPTV